MFLASKTLYIRKEVNPSFFALLLSIDSLTSENLCLKSPYNALQSLGH